MKIPVNVSYKDRLIPNLLISILSNRKFSSLLAVIDTGCEETILLSYKDALLLQIPIKEMITDKQVQGISGDKVDLCKYAKGLTIFLKKEDGSSFKINLDSFYISKNPNGANITLLGTNFLKKNNLKLFYNPNGEACLEKDD